jgi:hypothetical protein
LLRPPPRSRTSYAELRGLVVFPTCSGLRNVLNCSIHATHRAWSENAEGERVELPHPFGSPVFGTEADAVYRLDLP